MAGAVKRRLVIECGVAETRAALFDGDEAVKFWFAPARGDETTPRDVEAGDICFGKVKTVSKPLAGAFVDIGARVDAFLPLAKGETAPIEGARLIVGVKRPALASKGAVLVLAWRRGLAAAAQRAIEEDAQTGDGPRVLGSPADPPSPLRERRPRSKRTKSSSTGPTAPRRFLEAASLRELTCARSMRQGSRARSIQRSPAKSLSPAAGGWSSTRPRR